MFNEVENGKEFIKELSIILAKDFNDETFLNSIGKAYQGVVNGDKVGVFNQGGFDKSVIASCNPTFKTDDIASEQEWSLNNFMIPATWCYDALATELKRGEKLYELSTNDAFKKYASDYMEKSLVESVVARAFFASKTASDYTTEGLDGINGVLKQMEDYITNGDADASQRVTIATNTKAAMRNGTTAIDYLEDLIDAAPAEVKNSPNAVIIINQEFYDDLAYIARINKGIYIESQWTALFGGLRETTYNGYRLVIIPTLSTVMNKMVSGDKFYGKRDLAIMTTTDNLLFGSQSDEAAGVGQVKIWDDDNTQTTKALVKFSLGVVVADPKGFSVAY